MAIGKNLGLKDKLIKKTEKKQVEAPKTKRPRFQREATKGKTKMTFYISPDLLDKLYNFAYQERHSVTEAFNIALAQGLKGKR